MHLARTRHFQPAARQRPGLELDVDLGTGLGEREKAGTKAQHQVVAFKKGAAKVGEHELQVLEAHVLANPQAFTLVEHRRMGGVAVHAVGATRCDDTNFRHPATRVNQCAMLFNMLNRIADLHRAGMGAQQIGRGFSAAFDIKRVVHGARRMVFGRVERGEIKPVGLNLRALGHVKTHGAKNGFDPLQRQGHGVQAALRALPAGQADVERLGLELFFKLGLGHGVAARVQCGFDGLFGQIDGGTAGFLLFHGKLRHALHQFGDTARFAQKLRFGVLQVGGRLGLRKTGFGATDQLVEGIGFVHKFSWSGCGISSGALHNTLTRTML